MNVQKKLLSEILTFFNGKAPFQAEDGNGEFLIYGSNGPIGRSEFSNHENAIILGRVGAYCGSVAICHDKFWASDNTIVVKARNGYDLRYVYYRLLSTPLRSYASGAAQPLITQTILRGISVHVYQNLILQKRIASILSAYDGLIENNRRRIQLLEQAARLLYKEWFVHLRFPGHERVKIRDGAPEGWKKGPLSKLCTDIRKTVSPADLPEETPYIGLEHIPRRSITINNWGSASFVTSSKFKFQKSDIIFGKIRPYFHKVGLAIIDGITSSDAIVIRPSQNRFYHYALFLLSSDEFVSLASKTVREGSKMPRADWKFLLKCRFNIPSAAILELFDKNIDPIIHQLKNLSLQNRQLAIVRDMLLPRLMNGEIKV